MTIIRPLFTSILHSSRTRCCNSHFARPLIPGRTFAAPSRSKPAPTKSAPSITLDALSPEFVKEADSVNRIFTFQPEVVKKFEASRFPKFLDEEVPFRETYGLLLRQSTIDLINQIGNSAESQPGKSFILDGPQGAGKSATLLQIVNHFALSDWLVFYVPNAAEWTSGKYPFQPYGTTALFEQQSLAAEYLQQIKAWNNNLLSKITAKQFSAKNVKLENPNLLQIVEAGIKNPKIATSAVETVLEEASKNTKIPVLVAVDQVNALFAFTNYHDKKSNRLTGRDLALSNSFSKIFGESPKSPKTVTIGALSKTNSFIQSPPIESVLNKDKSIHIQIPKYSKKEVKSLLSYYKAMKVLWEEPSDTTVHKLMAFSNGNGSKLLKCLNSVV